MGVLGICLGLATISLLLPYTLSGDEWCWLIWGRDVGRLTLDTTACTVWKPLPVLFTTVISLAGDAAPMLWLLLVRTSWLVAMVLAYRVGTRLGGRPAGILAALGLLLIPDPNADWISYVRHGSTEPLIVALILAAVDRHLADSRLQALVLGCLAALARPEAWVVVLAYGATLWGTQTVRRVAIVAIVAVAPLLWLSGGPVGGRGAVSAAQRSSQTGPWQPHPATPAQGSGRPPTRHTEASRADAESTARPSARERLSAGLYVIEAAAQAVVLPIALLALVAVVRAFRALRRNGGQTDRVIAFLGAGVVGWIFIQVAGGLIGFPVTARFLIGPAAVISVLGAVGLVQTARRLSGKARTGVIAASAVVIVGFAVPRVQAIPPHLEGADATGPWPAVIRALAGAKAQGVLDRCGGTIYAVNTGGKRAREIPWRLDIPTRAVHRVPVAGTSAIERGIVVIRGGGYVLAEPTVGPANPRKRRTSRQLVGVGKWSAYEVGCQVAR